MNAPSSLQEAIELVLSEISKSCERVGRYADEVTLVAVTKTVPVEVVLSAREFGLLHFAENYADELAAKAPLVAATWHFLGKLQSGTARHVADLAHVVHSAEPGGALAKIGRRAAASGRTLTCLVQVDFTEKRQGVPPDQLRAFARDATSIAGIEVAGLMTLPPWTGDPDGARPYFRRLRELRDDLRSTWPGITQLSMGMSGDYSVAVEEGATMVRVGTALFGQRPRG